MAGSAGWEALGGDVGGGEDGGGFGRLGGGGGDVANGGGEGAGADVSAGGEGLEEAGGGGGRDGGYEGGVPGHEGHDPGGGGGGLVVWGVMERGEMEWWEDGMLPGGVGELVTVVYAVLFDGVPFTEEPVLGNEASAGPGLFVFGEDVLDDVGVVEDVVVACCDDLTGVSDLWVCLVRGDIPEIDCKR